MNSLRDPQIKGVLDELHAALPFSRGSSFGLPGIVDDEGIRWKRSPAYRK